MSEWIFLGKLDESNCDFSIYGKDIGVYKGEMNAEVVYVGKATEKNNGGFRKRLRDYTRKSDSARCFEAGTKMFENKALVNISIQIIETKIQAQIIENNLIKKLQPKWNRAL